jgi:hypothetical protein
MNPADGADPASTSWEPWPARGGAKVVFLPGERKAAERIAGRLFRRPLDAWEYAALAGAPDQAQVEVGVYGGRLYIELGDPARAAYRAYYYVRLAAEQLVVVNDGFQILLRSLRHRGLGLCMFHRQVTAAAALGVDRIELVAGRRADENGYYTWPRFGFEALLPARLRRRLPIGLEHARTVLDIMDCEKGRTWWREHGVTVRAMFALVAGSRSQMVLDRYLRTKMNSASGTKRNLEHRPTMLYSDAR